MNHELSTSDWSRRDFLKAAGFAVGTAALAGCSRGVERRALPLAEASEAVTPGRANWYATLCTGCGAGCGVLAKCRDGRPIKLEGNAEHPLSQGGLCAVGQAMLLSLYDSRRLGPPLAAGQPSDWAAADRAIQAGLARAQAEGRAIAVLSHTVASPTLQAGIDALLAHYGGGRHVQYDALSASAALATHEAAFGVRALPAIHFERADVVVSVDADFLGTWLAPVPFTAGWRAGRTLAGTPPRCSYHVQFEGRLSLTGSKADRRIALVPSEYVPTLAALRAELRRLAGEPADDGAVAAPPAGVDAGELRALARRLWAARGAALVLCGANDPRAQQLALACNDLLGNYRTPGGEQPLDLLAPSYQARGDDRAAAALGADLRAGTVGALLIFDADPVAELPDGAAWAAALRAAPLSICVTTHRTETAEHAAWVCPDHHPLECWADAEPVAGLITVGQPLIAPLSGSRALVESLARWRGASGAAYDLRRAHWRERLWPRRTAADRALDFDACWDRAVHDGFFPVVTAGPAPSAVAQPPAAGDRTPGAAAPPAADAFELVLYAKVGMHGGAHAQNPWLHELPDPISKVVWDNYVALAPAAARALGVADGDLVRLTAPGADGAPVTLELPALLQPGQHPRVAAVALGYGRLGTDRFAGIGPAWLEGRPTVAAGARVGVNAAPLLARREGHLHAVAAVTPAKIAGRRPLARTQQYHSLSEPAAVSGDGAAPRPVVQQTTLAAYARDAHAGAHHRHAVFSLWDDDHRPFKRRWGMTIDLSACTGCAGCVIACQAENNVPVVGKDEVARQREMHWLRIDRYYSGEGEDAEVIHQPMLCQQCDNAPCETVCPVLATVHSEEGLNTQVYNRCVGTRYCANNCPYKARRFNWFDYRPDDDWRPLALNPDLTVRMRGVMEKCSFCVQRIQEAKAEARRLGGDLADGDVQPACVQSCPARALVFGDLNDETSRVAQQARDGRFFRVLEELNVQPSVGYLTLVRNREA